MRLVLELHLSSLVLVQLLVRQHLYVSKLVR